MRLRQGDDQGAETIFQEVLTTYAKHPRLAEAVSLMAQTYYDYALRQERGQSDATPSWSGSTTTYILKAVEKWRIITDQLAEDPSITPTAFYWSAEVYFQLGDYPATLRSCTELVKRWPSHEKAWVVHVIAFKTYWQQMEEGTLTEQDADAEMARVRSALLDRYSSSPAAAAIRLSMQEKQPPAPPRYRQDRR
jgi:outer membrane protein assembly factor BamD (BamD/ComL family)